VTSRLARMVLVLALATACQPPGARIYGLYLDNQSDSRFVLVFANESFAVAPHTMFTTGFGSSTGSSGGIDLLTPACQPITHVDMQPLGIWTLTIDASGKPAVTSTTGSTSTTVPQQWPVLVCLPYPT